MAAENMLQGDYSRMYGVPSYNDFMADWQSNWLGEFASGTAERDKRDFALSEQAEKNAFVRDMMKLNEQNIFDSNEAQKERDWAEYMRSTAYQATMADMKAAGLNPILAYQQGASSTPSGSAASSGTGNASVSGRHKSSSSLGSVASIVKGVLDLVGGIYGVAADATQNSLNRQSRERIAAMRRK